MSICDLTTYIECKTLAERDGGTSVQEIKTA